MSSLACDQRGGGGYFLFCLGAMEHMDPPYVCVPVNAELIRLAHMTGQGTMRRPQR